MTQALTLALEALKAYTVRGVTGAEWMPEKAASAIAAIEAELAASQEPVAWGLFAKADGAWHLQPPVRFLKESAEADRDMYKSSNVQVEVRPLYAAPQPAPVAPVAQPLATAQIDAMLTEDCPNRREMHDFARAVEVAHGIGRQSAPVAQPVAADQPAQFEIIDRLGQRHRFDHATHFWVWADEAEHDIAVFRRCEDEDVEEVKRFLFPLVVGDVSPDICMSMPLMTDARVTEAIAAHVAAQPVAEPRQGLSDAQIDKLLEAERMRWSSRKGPPTYEFAMAFARAIERTLAEAWGVKLEGGAK
jgi:hypothetical protein